MRWQWQWQWQWLVVLVMGMQCEGVGRRGGESSGVGEGGGRLGRAEWGKGLSVSETLTGPGTDSGEGNYFRVNLNNETQLRGVRLPCQCEEGECGCCSGNVLQNFNIHVRQHFCVNMTYEREDASLGVKMSFNDVVLLSSRVSGQNPPPICIPIPRVTNIKFCGRFTNVYFIGRNIHACVSVETEWNNRTVFSYSFDCVRLGVNGVAIIPPEAGGGLPHPSDQEIDQIEEYDELLENQTTKRPNKKRTTIRRPAGNDTAVRTTTRKP